MDRGSPLILIMSALFVALAIVLFCAIVSPWRKMDIVQRLSGFAFIAVLLCTVNSLMFSAISMDRLGGEAKWGKIEGRTYFVGNHGNYHQVSASTYYANLKYDTWSDIALGLSLAMFGALLFWRRFIQRARFGSVESLMRADGERYDGNE